jgi:hypothetical protein
MPDGAEHAVLGFSGQAVEQIGPSLILLGQRERAIACGAYVISRDHRSSPVHQTRRSLAFRRREWLARSVWNKAWGAPWGATVISVTPHVTLPGKKHG